MRPSGLVVWPDLSPSSHHTKELVFLLFSLFYFILQLIFVIKGIEGTVLLISFLCCSPRSSFIVNHEDDMKFKLKTTGETDTMSLLNSTHLCTVIIWHPVLNDINYCLEMYFQIPTKQNNSLGLDWAFGMAEIVLSLIPRRLTLM